MSDPRFTVPRYSDPWYTNLRLMGRKNGGVWKWVAVVAVVAYIAIIIIAGQPVQSNTASNNLAPIPNYRNASAPITTSPSTAGSGWTSAQPLTPAPTNRGAH